MVSDQTLDEAAYALYCLEVPDGDRRSFSCPARNSAGQTLADYYHRRVFVVTEVINRRNADG